MFVLNIVKLFLGSVAFVIKLLLNRGFVRELVVLLFIIVKFLIFITSSKFILPKYLSKFLILRKLENVI